MIIKSIEEANRLMSIKGFVVSCGVFININSTGNGGATYESKIHLDYDDVLKLLKSIHDKE